MHALVIGPLTSRLRDSLRLHLSEKKSTPSEPIASDSDLKNEVPFVTQQTMNAFKGSLISKSTSN